MRLVKEVELATNSLPALLGDRVYRGQEVWIVTRVQKVQPKHERRSALYVSYGVLGRSS